MTHRPYSPGSIGPVRLRPGRRLWAHEQVDRPKPLGEMAEAVGLRAYRDVCGDDYLPGRCGEVFRLSVRRLGVQIGGPRPMGPGRTCPRDRTPGSTPWPGAPAGLPHSGGTGRR